MNIIDLFEAASQHSATEIHLSVGLPPVVRINGELVVLPSASPRKSDPYDLQALNISEQSPAERPAKPVNLTGAAIAAMIEPYVTDEQLQQVAQGQMIHFVACNDQSRFLMFAIYERGDLAVMIRVVPRRIPTLEDLGVPPIIAKLTQFNRGLVLVTGFADSGVSSLTASMLNTVNLTRSSTILTVEDPIEYVHGHKLSVVIQRDVGRDVESIEQGARDALRWGANIVFLSDLPSPAVADLAIQLAESGTLVIANLKCDNSEGTIRKLLDMESAISSTWSRRLSEVLQAVVGIRQLPRSDRPGSVYALEIMIAIPAVRSVILERSASVTGIIESSAHHEMVTMDASIAALFRRGSISRETAVAQMSDPSKLK